MRRHVCHVFHGFGPGGAEVRTAMVISGLGNGFRHTIVALNGHTSCGARIDPSIDVDYMVPPRRKWGRLHPLYIGKSLRARRPDLLFTYNWGAIDAAIGAVLCGLRPWVQVMDGFDATEARSQRPRRRLARRAFYRRARHVVVVSKNLATIATETWGIRQDRLLHIPNGIDTARFSPGDGGDVRARLGLGPTDLLVGCIAHIRPEKNPLGLLQAFRQVVERQPNVHLVLVGKHLDPPTTDEVMRGIASMALDKRVHLAGSVEDTVPYYRALDVFALSSRTEQMPLSIAEAMACGKPVLSTDVGDVSWMVSGPNKPYVIAQDNTEGYADALATLVADASLRNRLGQANRTRAHEEFALDRMVAEYRALYERLCGAA